MLPILYVVVMIEFRFEYDFSLAESVKYYDENMEKHVISFRKVACAIREKIRCECAAPHQAPNGNDNFVRASANLGLTKCL